MRRDTELVRLLLRDYSQGMSRLVFTASPIDDEEKYEKEKKIIYHMELMREAGLITYKEKFLEDGGFMLHEPPKLTWKGHDFSVAISDELIWNETKEALKSEGLDLEKVTFDTVVEYAKFKAKEKLGLN